MCSACLNLLGLSFYVSTSDVGITSPTEAIIVVASQISVLQLPGHVPADHPRQPVGHLAQDVGYCQQRQLDVAVWFPEHDHDRFHDCSNPTSAGSYVRCWPLRLRLASVRDSMVGVRTNYFAIFECNDDYLTPRRKLTTWWAITSRTWVGLTLILAIPLSALICLGTLEFGRVDWVAEQI